MKDLKKLVSKAKEVKFTEAKVIEEIEKRFKVIGLYEAAHELENRAIYKIAEVKNDVGVVLYNHYEEEYVYIVVSQGDKLVGNITMLKADKGYLKVEIGLEDKMTYMSLLRALVLFGQDSEVNNEAIAEMVYNHLEEAMKFDELILGGK